MTVDERKIDETILLPVALRIRKRLKTDPEKWVDYEIEQLRSACGPKWAAMSLQNIRLQCCNLRKKGQLGTVGETNNHGATCREKPPTEYEEYLCSPHWRAFRLMVLDFWEYRCCWCYGDERIEVHHRTYQRLHKENLSDCVCLCRACHIMAGRAQKRAVETAKANEAMMW